MKKLLVFLIMIASFAIIVSLKNPHIEAAPFDYGPNLALGRRVVSTPNTDAHVNSNAVDGNSSTRYAAQGIDNAWWYVDLGAKEKIKKVVIEFEAAYAKTYDLQVSNDGLNWFTAVRVNNTGKTTDTIVFDEMLLVQFVKFQGVLRGLTYGYSFYEFSVYGPRDKAYGKTVTASSVNSTYVASNITSGDNTQRWESSVSDNQWVIIDLGSKTNFDLMKIRWGSGFARIFNVSIHPSTSATTPTSGDSQWNVVGGSDVGLGEVDTLRFGLMLESRYIKLSLIQRQNSEDQKKSGTYPWNTRFMIVGIEVFDWGSHDALVLGSNLEFSKNIVAWPAMSNIVLNEDGLLLAPVGYPTAAASAGISNLGSMASGNIPGFESYATYNPAVIYDYDNHLFRMIYRTELPDNFNNYFGSKMEAGHMSTLSYAFSYDGFTYQRGPNNPVIWPTSSQEAGGGSEDPRIFRITNDPNRGGKTTYYITYTAYNNSQTKQFICYTHDFITYTKVGDIAPGYGNQLKSGSFLTDPSGEAVKINDPRPGKTGMVYMIYMKDGGYARVGFTSDVTRVNSGDIVDIGATSFGNNSIEKMVGGNESCMALTNIYGPNDDDIYLMYGGTVLSNSNIQYQQSNASGWFYALGALKCTKSNPFELTNTSLDLSEPTIYPTDTNKIDYGLFNKCMFADSMIRFDSQWFLYYGAGDMYVGMAHANGDFSAGAISYSLTGTNLKMSTFALNKSFTDTQGSKNIKLKIEIKKADGTLVETLTQSFVVNHFSHDENGIYSKGTLIEHTINLSTLTLPPNYYIDAYLSSNDLVTKLSNSSCYAVFGAVVTKV